MTIGAWPMPAHHRLGAGHRLGRGPGGRDQLDRRDQVGRVDRVADEAAVAPGEPLGEPRGHDGRGGAREDAGRVGARRSSRHQSACLISRSSGAFSCTQSAPASASSRVGHRQHAPQHVGGGGTVQHVLGGEIGQQPLDRGQRRRRGVRVGIPQADRASRRGRRRSPRRGRPGRCRRWRRCRPSQRVSTLPQTPSDWPETPRPSGEIRNSDHGRDLVRRSPSGAARPSRGTGAPSPRR